MVEQRLGFSWIPDLANYQCLLILFLLVRPSLADTDLEVAMDLTFSPVAGLAVEPPRRAELEVEIPARGSHQTLQVTVPGAVSLRLPKNEVVHLSLTADGLWSEPTVILVRKAKETARLSVFASGSVRGNLNVPNSVLPNALELTLEELPIWLRERNVSMRMRHFLLGISTESVVAPAPSLSTRARRQVSRLVRRRLRGVSPRSRYRLGQCWWW